LIADHAERVSTLDPSRSFIVEAPAGSGKTELLVQRFLKLLSVVERPESIVAMTFTRKAAGEMKERILDALLQAQLRAPLGNEHGASTRELALAALDRDRIQGWGLLLEPDRLQILTIDAVCAMLTRQMPVISDLSTESQIVEDARELYRRAARDTLRNLTEGEAGNRELFHRVALHFDNDIARLEMQIAAMLQKRDQWQFLARGDQPSLVDDLCGLLHSARQALREVFRQTATVDFTEVAHAARKALGTPTEPTELLYTLDYRIEHLLVDEFQDTSRGQYELLDALTGQWSDGDNRTLFLVGDPMQSVYRFREAEVALFLQCWEQQQLGAVRLTPVRLTTNFRSTGAILNWVEGKFAPIMSEDDRRMGAVRFRMSTAGRGSGGAEPQLVSLVEDDGHGEADEIVKIIKDRERVPGSVVILVRSRAHIAAILPALRKAEIAYQAIEIDLLGGQQHILDLVSLTRAVLHLGDRVSWLACLRAPWCGLMLADLAALAEDQPQATILDLLSDPERLARLSANGRQRAARTQQVLLSTVEQVGRLPLRDLVEGCWLALGGAAVLQESNQHEDVETYFSLLEGLDEGGILYDFSLLAQRLELLYARPSSLEAPVQVMTVHQAKGLEFDTVILPQIDKDTRSSERELLVWTEEVSSDGKLLLHVAAQPQKGADDAAYEEIADELKQKEAHEVKRLFYVACTRARNELYLLGSVKRKKNRSECAKPPSGAFLGLIWDAVTEQFQSAVRQRVPVQQSLLSVEAGPARRQMSRLPDSWRSPRLDASVRWESALAHATASSHQVSYEWVNDPSRHAGTVVHDLLKRFAGQTAEEWSPAIQAALAPTVKAELLRFGVPHAQEPGASERVFRALKTTLQGSRGRWIMTPHAGARSEWAVAGRIQDRLVSGSIDRMFRDEQGRLWIIDFKTSEHLGGRLQKFLDEEQRRYRLQLESYATLVSRIESGPIWLGLYFPLLDAWREWPFAEEAAATHYTGE
jgi:ATP-dependent helicase/nuclease subunit A